MSLLNELLVKFPTLNKEDIEHGIDYLKRFAHLNGSIDDQSVIQATKSFQEFFDLDQDGLLNPKTLRAMTSLRCGVKDVLHLRTEEAKWRKNNLTYFIESYDKDLSKALFDELIFKAFQSWCDVADLKIQPTNSASRCDILIGVGQGRGSDFDGPSGTLAWAELPNGSDRQLLLKFDLDETWIDNPTKRGILLQNVAAHEGGHNLGLVHSKAQGALLAPFYNANIAKPQSNDDIPRIQEMYGKPKTNPVPPPTVPEPPKPESNVTIIKIVGKLDSIEIPGWRTSKLASS